LFARVVVITLDKKPTIAVTVWTVDFKTPVCKLYFLFINAKSAKEKEEKRKKSAAACWCFEVCSPYSTS
jgi:hypothetical protein